MLIEATTQTTEGHVYIVTGNDDVNVGAGVVINSTSTDAITTWDGQHTFTVSGEIRSHDDGINTIGVLAAQTVIIALGGRITSGYASALPYIEDSDGVILDGIGSTLVNRGTITSHGSALSLFVHDGGTTTITNFGLMSATKYGIWNKFGAGTLNVTNSGTIESPSFSYFGGNFVDNLTNSGLMKGTVDLGNGDDSYVGTGGKVVGSILGGDGNDRFVLGVSAERIDGGAGIDTLDFSARLTSITVDLSNAANNRGDQVLGDVYINIEAIRGSVAGDRLTGDALDNMLEGGAGSDRLFGGLGNDTLVGGTGTDYLTGGAGSDAFVFYNTTSTRDFILDFKAAEDVIQLEGSAFGLADYQGSINTADFLSGTDKVARDGSDHFIFRTTDATLWFDRDGTGSSQPILIANLNDDAMISSWNIWIV